MKKATKILFYFFLVTVILAIASVLYHDATNDIPNCTSKTICTSDIKIGNMSSVVLMAIFPPISTITGIFLGIYLILTKFVLRESL